MVPIVEAVAKQAHNTTVRRALRVRNVFARGSVGSTLGNHGRSRLTELYVISSKEDEPHDESRRSSAVFSEPDRGWDILCKTRVSPVETARF